MNRVAAGVFAVVVLQPGHAFAQAGPPAHAGHHGAAPPAAKDSTPAKQPGKAKPGEARAYDSPFADYRPFDPQEPAKPWRAANEEVREAGGHVEVMKAIEAAKSARPRDPKQ